MLLEEIGDLSGIALGSSVALGFFDGKQFEIGLIFKIDDAVEKTSGKVSAFADFEPKLFVIALCRREVANSHAHMIDAPSLSQEWVRNRRLSDRTNNGNSYADRGQLDLAVLGEAVFQIAILSHLMVSNFFSISVASQTAAP